jgi:hypothetical protein
MKTSGHARSAQKWAEKLKRRYSCKEEFELTDEVLEPALVYGKMSIKRDIKWKNMMLTVFVKNSEAEDVPLCKRYLASGLSRSTHLVRKSNTPMTAGSEIERCPSA